LSAFLEGPGHRLDLPAIMARGEPDFNRDVYIIFWTAQGSRENMRKEEERSLMMYTFGESDGARRPQQEKA
jgi:hypothetical protein